MQIEISNLSKVYTEGRGLHPVSLNVEKGELIAIIGHNGAGKSTLLKILAHWHLPDTGDVLVDGITLKNRAAIVKKVGFVPEVPNLFDFFPLHTI